MPQETPRKNLNRTRMRICNVALGVAVLISCVLFSYSQAFANFSSESTDQIIGVGRIQSSTIPVSSEAVATAHFEMPEQLAEEPTQAVTQLAQPSERAIENAEGAIANISLIQRFGEPDAAGWFTTKASAYGPSSAGQFTSLGTELTLTSMDIGIHIDHIDLLGRFVELKYGDVILRCRIVDTGTMAPDGRLFDLQPGVCTAFGAETPEFGWGVRTIQWRFAD